MDGEQTELGFSVDGVPYRLVGEVVAGWWLLLRRLRRPAASPGSSRERVDSLTGSGVG